MSRSIITVEDVLAAKAAGGLDVPSGALVTERAAEIARDQGIALRRAAEEPPPSGGSPGGAGQRVPATPVTTASAARAPAPPAAPASGSASGARRPTASSLPSGSTPRPMPSPAPASPAGHAVLSAVGRNRPGVLAEISAAVGQAGGDVREISQRVHDPWFQLVMIVALPAGPTSLAAFKSALESLSRPDDYRVMVAAERVFETMHRV